MIFERFIKQVEREPTPDEVKSFLTTLSKNEVIDLLFAQLRPPKLSQMTELNELHALTSMHNEESVQLLENWSYEELVGYFNAKSPEERLIHKGRYEAWQQLLSKSSAAPQDLEAKDIEESLKSET